MNETKSKSKRPQRPSDVQCCVETECTTGRRNLYFPGKRLTPDSFQAEQHYLVERRRLINRAIHGWGVVYGFDVTIPDTTKPGGQAPRLTIGAGLALDRAGRELVQTDATPVDLPAILFLDEKGNLQPGVPSAYHDPRYADRTAGECWLLQAHYAERLLDRLTFTDACNCRREEWNQVCETVRYSLRRIDCKKCCVQFECELECACATGPCCEDIVPRRDDKREHQAEGARHDRPAPAEVEQARPYEEQTRPQAHACGPDRGGCRCLCDHLKALKVGAECTRLHEIEEPCARVRVDLHNGVPLACVKLKRGDCGWELECVYDDCGPRRLVKRNDLLFDLIRGCDLTRIVEVSWGKWHRSETAVPYADFEKYFGAPSTGGNLTGFRVRFSRPVYKSTVTADCFAMTVFFREKEGGWRSVMRVPIVGVRAEGTGELTEKVALLVRTRWVNDAIRGAETLFDAYGARVEIEIRGDFILDCNGQALDANAVGLRDVPSGNGTPGGTYLSTFRVGKRTVPETEDATC
jgi:hypothetical protein